MQNSKILNYYPSVLRALKSALALLRTYGITPSSHERRKII